MTWDLMWITGMGNHVVAGDIQYSGVLVVLVSFYRFNDQSLKLYTLTTCYCYKSNIFLHSTQMQTNFKVFEPIIDAPGRRCWLYDWLFDVIIVRVFTFQILKQPQYYFWCIKLVPNVVFVDWIIHYHLHLDGIARDCSYSIANALELLQSCTEPLMWCRSVNARKTGLHC